MTPVVVGVLAIIVGVAIALYILCIAFVREGLEYMVAGRLSRLRYLVFAPITLLDWYIEDRRKRTRQFTASSNHR